MTDTLKEYYFTDKQIEFLLRLVRNHAQDILDENDVQDENAECSVTDFANQIEDQIVNHSTND